APLIVPGFLTYDGSGHPLADWVERRSSVRGQRRLRADFAQRFRQRVDLRARALLGDAEEHAVGQPRVLPAQVVTADDPSLTQVGIDLARRDRTADRKLVEERTAERRRETGKRGERLL